MLRPADLATREILLGEEVAKAVMISVECEVLAAFQVVAVDLDSMDDGEEF
jgi:hypothetical protein